MCRKCAWVYVSACSRVCLCVRVWLSSQWEADLGFRFQNDEKKPQNIAMKEFSKLQVYHKFYLMENRHKKNLNSFYQN